MARIIRFGIVLIVIFGLTSLFQAAGLDQGTAIMLTSIAFVALALIVESVLKTKQSSDNDRK